MNPTSLVCLAIAGFCAILVVYPYFVYPAILRLLPSRPPARDEAHRCSATLVFCAYNEAASLPEKIANLAELKARHPDLQILAFDDGSTDDTHALLAARPELLDVVRGPGRSGKAHGMKILAARATGDVIVFTDANVVLRPDAIDRVMAWYADSNVGGLCGRLEYRGDAESATAQVGGLYWRLEEKLKSEESRTGSTLGADGSIFSIRREFYPSFPDTVLDDLTVSMAVIFAGKRLIKVEDVVAYERLVSVRGDEFSRKIRIAARAFHTHLHLRPQLLKMTRLNRFKYFSRKMMRWFGGLFLIVGAFAVLVAAAATSVWLGLIALIAAAAAVAIGQKAKTGPVASIAEIVIALIGTLIGVVKAMRGQTFVTWTPAKSR